MPTKLACKCRANIFQVTVNPDSVLLGCAACGFESTLTRSGWRYTQGNRQADERARAHDAERAEALASNGPEPINVVSPQARWDIVGAMI